jgi:hypothetical protein
MPLVVSNKKQYETATEGVHKLEIVSIKEITTQDDFGEHEKVQFLFLCLDQKDSKGDYVSIVQRFTKSLHEKAMLRKFLSVILGLKNIETLDLETLQFATFDGVVVHTENKGRTWVNITAAIPNTLKVLAESERQAKKQDNRKKSGKKFGKQTQPADEQADDDCCPV